MRAAENYGRALYRATAGQDGRQAAASVDRLVERLAERHELHLAPKVIEAFEDEARRAEGVRRVRVTSAEALSEERRRSLADAFAEAVEGPVDVRWDIDPSLVGGAVVRYDDVLLDASVKGRLERLKKSLT